MLANNRLFHPTRLPGGACLSVALAGHFRYDAVAQNFPGGCMPRYEYKIVPAPSQGEKARGVRSVEDRFAFALSNVINALAREDWEYVRCDTLPTEERTGLTKRRTVYVNLLVFRRQADEDEAATTAVVGEKPVGGLRGLTRRFSAPAVTAATHPPAPMIAAPSEGAAPKLGPATTGERSKS